VPPVIVYTGKDLAKDELARLDRYAQSIVIKGVRSPERLVDEVSLFLHRVEVEMSPESRALLERVRTRETSLVGRRILVVDDDMRNVFAVASALERHGVLVRDAESGPAALEVVRAERVDAVLMDVMMPEMDGYETMAEIRKLPRGRDVPIVALTAKAMKGDRERCLQAGASDYVTKPVDTEQLLSSLRVWLA
jgi:CheY-like chemotaxis protein